MHICVLGSERGSRKGIITAPNAQNVDSFCAAGVLLCSGKFFAAGGAAPVTSYTGTETTVVDPDTSSAVNGVSTLVPHWYSTMTSLPDGRKIITGGGVPFFGESSTTPEVYTEGEGWQLLPGAKSEDAFGTTNYHFWYPRQWVTPSGSVFGISTEILWEMQVGGNGTIRTMFTFKGVPNNASLPNVGPTSTAVMYDIGKIIQVGGNGLNNDYQSIFSAAATTFDINSIGSGKVMFKDVASMHNARQWPNSIVLPDGKVLVTGGSTYADHAGENAVLAAELWDPVTGNWTVGDLAAMYHGYHSVSVWLPNGVVYVGGGGLPGPLTNFNFELYYPPYFFRRSKRSNYQSVLARRPTIISLSDNVGTYGDVLQLQLVPGDSVAQVLFSTLPSVTHSFDADMRRMTLVFQVMDNGVVEVTLPSSARVLLSRCDQRPWCSICSCNHSNECSCATYLQEKAVRCVKSRVTLSAK